MSDRRRTYVVDTHPLIWHFEGNPRLGPRARDILGDPDSPVIVPTLVLVDLAHVHRRGRTTITFAEALSRIEASPHCTLATLDEFVASRAPLSLNIHDGILVGTALVRRDVLGEDVALITKDEEIAASGLVEIVW